MLKSQLQPLDRLWTCSPSRIIALFEQAVQRLDLTALCPSRYSLRHGGASHDLLSGTRSLADIKFRGHWKSDNSLMRYAKATRALRDLHRVPPLVIKYGQMVADNLEDVFHQRVVPVPPELNLRQ